mmetsp:Transcript_25276/g.34210  ORF Transcript_25276/g.34210 Transcript_25276/m.34210 type:complete len:131 (-) Transcript_25276:21-413(-)
MYTWGSDGNPNLPPVTLTYQGPKKPFELAKTERIMKRDMPTTYTCGSSTSGSSAPPRACIATCPRREELVTGVDTPRGATKAVIKFNVATMTPAAMSSAVRLQRGRAIVTVWSPFRCLSGKHRLALERSP